MKSDKMAGLASQTLTPYLAKTALVQILIFSVQISTNSSTSNETILRKIGELGGAGFTTSPLLFEKTVGVQILVLLVQISTNSGASI